MEIISGPAGKPIKIVVAAKYWVPYFHREIPMENWVWVFRSGQDERVIFSEMDGYLEKFEIPKGTFSNVYSFKESITSSVYDLFCNYYNCKHVKIRTKNYHMLPDIERKLEKLGEIYS